MSGNCPEYFNEDLWNRLTKPSSEKEDSITIQELKDKIDALQKDFDLHVAGKYGVLYIPTKEEIIQITKEQLIEELRKVNLKM